MNTASHESPNGYRYPNRTDKVQAVRRIRGGEHVHDIAQQFKVSNIQVMGWLKEYDHAANLPDPVPEPSPEPIQVTVDPEPLVLETSLPPIEEETTMAKTTVQTRKVFTEAQKMDAVRKSLGGTKTGEITEQFGISHNTLYNWKDKYASKIKSGDKRAASPKVENADRPAAKTVAHSATSFKAGSSNENALLRNVVINQMLEIERLKGNVH